MWRRESVIAIAMIGVTIAGSPTLAQDRGRMGMGQGMSGMAHDSATMAQMRVIHELVVNNERIKRTVTNLPNGIRTVTTSDDPRLARLIKDHALTMSERVRMGDDPDLPMESPAVHAIFRAKDRIRTTTDTTASGVIVVQTAGDSAVVVALQQHAAEVTDLVQRGMVAMHEAMMKNRRGGRMMHRTPADTAFHAMQERGKRVMGVDQYASTHHFDVREDGGRIGLQSDGDDTVAVAAIRQHLKDVAKAFGVGDFSMPGIVHMRDVPGAKVMAAKRDVIAYTYRDLPRGGEVRIVSKDAAAIAAIHEFLAFQGREHHAK
jgi:hypothetical protein